MACYVYGKKVDEEHLFERSRAKTQIWDHGQGPICIRCGLPRGTVQYEEAHDRHHERTGHHLGSGACVEACDPEMNKQWWDIEPVEEN